LAYFYNISLLIASKLVETDITIDEN